MSGFEIDQRRACQRVGLCRSTYYYQSQAKDQTALRLRIRDIAASRVRYGYRRVHVLLVREGWQVNHKRVYRLYRREGLELRLKTRQKKRAAVPRAPPPDVQAPHDRWSMDFVSDRLADGAPIHRSQVVREFLTGQLPRLELVALPSYAPELNPDEGVWHTLKRKELANYAAPDLDALAHELQLAKERLARRPAVIRGYFREVDYL